MKNDGPVLIVSTIADAATDEVVRRLADRGVACLRVNTENYPFAGSLSTTFDSTGEQPSIAFDGKPVSMPASIWYRRMRAPSRPEDLDVGIYDFCLQENRAALLGTILGLHARWMNHPQAVWQAENKPYQLSVASSLGLHIPRTLISNNPQDIRAAFANFGDMIVKPVRSGYFVREGQEYSVFTSRVVSAHLDELDSAKLSPSIYQELIPKRFDLRITIVGRKVFAVAIDSQSDPAAAVDWRHTENPLLPHHSVSLPTNLEQRLLALMDAFGLSFGAVDMIETPEHDFVFLEVNPSGQWLWLDDILALGISDVVADWLARQDLP